MISFSFSSESFLFPSRGLPGPWVLLKWALQLLCIWGLPRELPVTSDRIPSSSEGTGLFCPLRALSADDPRCRGPGDAGGTEGAVGRCACPSPRSSAAHVLRLRRGRRGAAFPDMLVLCPGHTHVPGNALRSLRVPCGPSSRVPFRLKLVSRTVLLTTCLCGKGARFSLVCQNTPRVVPDVVPDPLGFT